MGTDTPDEAFQFASFDEEGSGSCGIVSGERSGMWIGRYKGIGEDESAIVEGNEASFEADMTGFYGFHFVSKERQTRLESLEDFIVKPCALILGECLHKRINKLFLL